MFSFQVSFFEDETVVNDEFPVFVTRDVLARCADALAAARCGRGAEGSFAGLTENMPDAGMIN